MPPPTDDFTPDDFAADDFVADDFTPDTTTQAPVENRQAITDIERAQINNLRPTPESAAKWLADRGYDATVIGGETVARKPGEPTYGKVEPTGFLGGQGLTGKVKELIRDLGPDAVDDYLELAAMAKGAGAAGGAGTALGGPLVGFGGALVGAGAASAATEAARIPGRKLAGFEETQPIPETLLQAGIGGAIAEGVGRGLGAGVKLAGRGLKAATKLPAALKRPLQRARAEVSEAGEIAAEQGTRRAYRTATTEFKKARAENRAVWQERLDAVSRTVDEALKEGEAVASSGPSLVFQTSAISATGKAPKRWTPAEVADPAWGHTAKILEKNPEIAEIGRRAFGSEYAGITAEGSKAASFSMANRNALLERYLEDKGADALTGAMDQYIRDLSKYFLSSAGKAARKGVSQETLDGLRQNVAGLVTPESAAAVRVFTTKLTGKVETPRLREARLAREAADIAHSEQLAKTTAAREKVANLRGPYGSPYASFSRFFTPTGRYGPMGAGAAIGATLGGPAGAFAGSMAGAAASEPIAQAGRHVSYALGEGIERLAKIPRMKSTAAWLKKLAAKNPKKARALYYAVTRAPTKR